jgi:two-component system response regulator MprA
VVGQRRRESKGHLTLVDARRKQPQRASAEPAVLIVDDEDAIRDFLRSAFEAEGYSVLAAGDGVAALALCERYQPDAILLDLMMPRLDGLGFLHEFRRLHGLTTPIFMMSAAWTATAHAQAAGVAGAFVKPFNLDEVLDAVAAAVRTRGRRSRSGPSQDGRARP